MLSGNCSAWSKSEAYNLCPTVTIVKWCHTVMQTVCQHQEGGRWKSTQKRVRNWKIDKYTYLRSVFRTQSNIHDGPFYKNSKRLKVVNYFCKKDPSQWLKVVNCFCKKDPLQMLNTSLYLLRYMHQIRLYISKLHASAPRRWSLD